MIQLKKTNMKKANVIQLCIIILGIIMGFLSLQYLLGSLTGLFFWIFNGGYGGTEMPQQVLPIFIIVGLQLLACWLLITRSGKIAEYIYEKSELGTSFKIISRPSELLFILLIIIGIYLLLTNLAPLLNAVFESFKRVSSRGMFSDMSYQKPVNWAQLILNVLLPLILLLCTKPLADYFAKHLDEEPLSLEETIEGDETN
jgi:ABC-type Na+ efflux pump permease subunit